MDHLEGTARGNGPAGRTSYMDQLARWNSLTDQLDGPARRTSYIDQLDRLVLYFQSLHQFACAVAVSDTDNYIYVDTP